MVDTSLGGCRSPPLIGCHVLLRGTRAVRARESTGDEPRNSPDGKHKLLAPKYFWHGGSLICVVRILADSSLLWLY